MFEASEEAWKQEGKSGRSAQTSWEPPRAAEASGGDLDESRDALVAAGCALEAFWGVVGASTQSCGSKLQYKFPGTSRGSKRSHIDDPTQGCVSKWGGHGCVVEVSGGVVGPTQERRGGVRD